MGEWRINFLNERRLFYQSGPESLTDFKIKFVVVKRISEFLLTFELIFANF